MDCKIAPGADQGPEAVHRPGVCHLRMCGKDIQAILEGAQALLYGLRHYAQGRRSAGLSHFVLQVKLKSTINRPAGISHRHMQVPCLFRTLLKVEQQSLLC